MKASERNYEAIEVLVSLLKSGYLKYEDGQIIGSRGNVIGEKTGKGQYYRIGAMIDGVRYRAFAHLVVYAYFHGMDELKKHETIDHVDGNKYNNRIENLEGCSRSENALRATDGLGIEKAREIKILLRDGFSMAAIARKYGVSNTTIRRIKIGKRYKDVKI